jgi:hypothetical protein
MVSLQKSVSKKATTKKALKASPKKMAISTSTVRIRKPSERRKRRKNQKKIRQLMMIMPRLTAAPPSSGVLPSLFSSLYSHSEQGDEGVGTLQYNLFATGSEIYGVVGNSGNNNRGQGVARGTNSRYTSSRTT